MIKMAVAWAITLGFIGGALYGGGASNVGWGVLALSIGISLLLTWKWKKQSRQAEPEDDDDYEEPDSEDHNGGNR